MSKIKPKRRKFIIKLKQKRRKKIKKLKEKYLKATSKEEKEKILEKVKKIAPQYPLENFLKLDKS
jgi:2-oxo-4-hydroxy-4-carboxy--5-ureidoimidazoline (OHCU) decarboxylase